MGENYWRPKEKRKDGESNSYWWQKENRGESIAKLATNRVNDWLNKSNSYITDYQKRYSGRKFNHEDAYVNDSGAWLETTNKRYTELESERQELLAYLDQNRAYLDPAWVKEVEKTLAGSMESQKQLINGAQKDHQYWSGFGQDEDLLKEYGSAQGVYEYQQRSVGYNKKYAGMSDKELEQARGLATINAMKAIGDDSSYAREEMEWLNSFVAGKQYDELLNLDAATVQKQIDSSTLFLGDIKRVSQWAVQNNVAPENMDRYVPATKEDEKNFALFKAITDRYGTLANAEDAVNANITDMEDQIKSSDHVKTQHKWQGVGNPNAENYDPEFDYYVQVGANKSDKPIDSRGLYKFLAEDEVEVYNYYLGKHGEDMANKYLDTLTDVLRYRRGNSWVEGIDDISYRVGDVDVLTGVRQTAKAGVGLIAGGEQFVRGVVQNFTNEELDASALMYANAEIMDDLDGFNKLAYQGTNVVGNMLPSIALSAATSGIAGAAGVSAATASLAGSVAGSAAMGFSAAGNAYVEGLHYGMSTGAARTYGILVGTAEGALEFVMGGIPALRGADDVVKAKIGTIKNGLLRAGANIGWDVIQEIGEEELQNFLEPAFRAIFTGEYDAPTVEELIETAIVTAVSTSAMNAGGMAINDAHANRAMVKTGKSIMGREGGVDSLLEQADYLSGITTGAEQKSLMKQTEKVSKKMDKGSTSRATAKQVGKLQNTVQTKTDAQSHDNYVKILTNFESKDMNGFSGKSFSKTEANDIADALVARFNGRELTNEQTDLLNSVKSNPAVQSIVESENRKSVEKLRAILEKANLEDPATYKSLTDRVGDEGRFGVSESGKAVIRSTGEEIDLDSLKVETVGNGRMTFKVGDQEVSAGDIDWADGNQSFLVSAVSNIENITPKDAQVVMKLVDMSKPIAPQINGIDEAFTRGFFDYSAESVKTGEFAEGLTSEQLMSAYELGKASRKDLRNAKVEDFKKMRSAAEAQAEKAEKAEGEKTEGEKKEGKKVEPEAKNLTITYDKGNGETGTIEENEDGDILIDGKKLNEKESGGVKVAQILHKMGLGTRFEFFRSYMSDTLKVKDKKTGEEIPARVFLDENGKEKIAYSGVYRGEDGVIRIDLDAYNGRGLTLNALAHELTHFIQQWSDKKYKVLVDFLMKEYENTRMTMHQRVLEEQKRLQDIRGKKVPYSEAYDEVVANAMSKMFDDGKLVEKLTKLKAQDKDLAAKLWEGFKKILSKFIKFYKQEGALFRDADAVMQVKETFDQLQNMFAEALVEASENYQASILAQEAEAVEALGENAEVETNEAGELLVASSEDGSVLMYSEHTYLDGGREKLEIALRQNGHTAEEIEQTLSYVDDALDYIKILAAGYAQNMGYNALSNHLVADIVTNVKTGKQVMSTIVNNGDYPVNIDLSLICKKRVAYMNLMSRLIRDGIFDQVNYDGAAIAEVNEILRDNGFETACLGCFVESRRLQFQTWAETIVSEWNAEVEKRNSKAEEFGFAKGKMENLTDADIDALTRELESVKKNDQGNVNLGQGNSVTRMGRLLDALPSLQKKLTVEDLLTPEGLTALRKHDGSLFSIVKSRYGAASPKIVQDFNPYASEIAMLTFANVKNITNNAVKGAQAYITEVKNEYGKLTKTKGESKENFKKRKADHEQRIQDEAMRRYLYDIGGARIQSFSDFMIENIFDYIQIFADLAAKKLPLHGYTKEIVCLRLFGMTGAKWNGSLIAHVERSMSKEFAGLLPADTADGIRVTIDGKDYVIGFDDYARNAATGGKSFIQSIGMKDIIALQLDPRYSPYVGNITIGVSDKQILAMLDNPLFRMVIPYHASGMLPIFAKLVGVDLYNDYTDYQNTTVRQYYDLDGNPVSELKNAKDETVKADTSYAFNAEIQKTKDAKTAANNYLKWCAQRHPVYDGSTLVGYATFNPKFSSSPYGTDFTRHENYYKLLEDFNTYDCITGESSVQGGVTMNFPSEANRLTDQQMADYKNALRETGIFTEKDIEKYAKKADMTFKEIIAAEVGNRADYAKTQEPKWESTVNEVEAKLLKDHAREMQPNQETDVDTEADFVYDGGKNGEKQEVNLYGQSGKAEDHASFIRRMHEGSRRVKQIGETVFAYEPARAIDTSGSVSDAAREFRRLGIKYFYHNGLEYNHNGITYVDNGALCTIGQQVVGIYAKAFGDGMEFAGHEAFHVWKNSTGWNAYVETLRRNINFTSSVYGIKQADTVLREYFGGNVGALSSNEAKAQFLEELYALVSGKIHSGANEAGLKTMFKDYTAVKAAWDDLLKKQATQKGQQYSSHETDADRVIEDTTDIRYSEHDIDYSNRSLLANAFEGITKSSEEYKLVQEYKGRIKLLNEQEEKLAKLKAEIREIRFTKGKYDAKKLKELEAKEKEVAKSITRQDRKLLWLEASGPLRKLIEQERKKEAQKTKAHVKEIVQNKKLRAEQAELRHKIRKAVRDLDKLLNKGNKKTNVKEDMKGFVSKALELADYLFTDHISNDELIRKGIDEDLVTASGKAALVKETEDILSQLYDNADNLTDEEFTRLDKKRKANEDKLRDLLTSQRNRRLSTPVYDLFNDIVTEYAGLKNSSQESVKAAYNPDVERFLRSYIGEQDGQTDSDRQTLLKNMRVADMTTDELWKLYNAYTMVLHSVRNANKLFVEGKTESIEKMVDQIMGDFSKRKAPNGKVATVLRNLSNKIGWNYEKLYYALDRIGSEAFTELVMNIANSENIVMQDVIEAAEFRDEIVKKYGFNKWDVNKKIDREFLDNTGKKFKLTLGELMALYAYSRREGAWDHIEYGGFVFGETALTNPRPADSYKLSKEQCEAITDLLTKEQKGYVEQMQKFLSETMGEKGNEVSMLLYGIKMFGEKNYFPIHIAGQFKAQANESQAKAAAGFGTMSNAGFTHALTPKAKAPFVLEGFNEIWADHVNEMSRYHGTVPALEDMRRVMNRSFYSESGMESMSIKQLMENSYGKEAVEYFNNLYREANSGAITDKLEEDSKWLLSRFRKNSVAYSLSVLVQQPASVVRAYAMIPKKYFGVKGFGTITSGVVKAVTDKWTKAHTKAYNEMLKYAPGVTMAKEIGGFDTATGGSIRSYLLDTKKTFGQKVKTGTALEKGKAVLELVDDNAVANLPNLADKIAWIEIWNACKRETVATHKDLTPNSEEFMKAVGDRFTEVIRATQVYDSNFAKSPMLKSKRVYVQMLVSFMNEPNTVANMAESAVRDATRGNWKGGIKKAAVLIHSIIFTNVLKSLIYAMRDDDEDETYIEKYIESVFGNMMNDFWALNYIPLARDAWSLAQGYDVNRADMAIVADTVDALNRVIKNETTDTEGMTEEQLVEFDKKCTEAKWKLVESMASFFGIPVKNIRREIKGAFDHARIASANKGLTTKHSAVDKLWDAVTESIPLMKTESKQDKLYEAILAGDTTYVNRLKAGYKDEDAYNSAVRKLLRENDPRIRAAAQAYYDGDLDEYKRIFREIQADDKHKLIGFDNIMEAVMSEVSKIRGENEPKTESSGYTASDYVNAVLLGHTDIAEGMKEDIISHKVANGKTQEEAEESFNDSVETSTRNAFDSGLLDEAGTEKMLREYAGMDEEDAAAKTDYWSFIKAHPQYRGELSQANVEKYHEFAEPAEIPLDVFVQYLEGTSGLETIRDEWGDEVKSKREQVLEVIDSLPLTWQQKDALYLAAGYAESEIWDVPW